MASNHAARAVRPASPRPVRPSHRHGRFRWMRRFLLAVVALMVAAIAAYGYVLQVYAPRLREEVRTIPANVRVELAAHNTPYTPLSAISPDLQHAIISIEDHRFWVHPGVDPIGTIRAAFVNAKAKKLDQGGSTLEEQLVKRAIVHDDRTIHGKLRTMVLAWAVDQVFPKRKVLELYLNAAYYGQGAYGPAAAARIYFGTDAANLTVAQAAFLAAMPQAPSIYGDHPYSAPVRYRWLTVLRDMATNGYITPAMERIAERTHLTFALPNP